VKNSYKCSTCNAFFSIDHEMDTEFFDVYFCPFCGGEIDDEDEVKENDRVDV
tara:strand:- start:824 stop:979 length:156 start_codon:yes stop_codon:yes gene_type:complete